jgi:hypothetical protein
MSRTGADEHERGDSFGRLPRDFERARAPHGTADDDEWPVRGVVQDVFGPRVHRVAEPVEIGRVRGRAQAIDLRAPHACVEGKRVQEDPLHRRTVSRSNAFALSIRLLR